MIVSVKRECAGLTLDEYSLLERLAREHATLYEKSAGFALNLLIAAGLATVFRGPREGGWACVAPTGAGRRLLVEGLH
jgi:hypothetical protein